MPTVACTSRSDSSRASAIGNQCRSAGRSLPLETKIELGSVVVQVDPSVGLEVDTAVDQPIGGWLEELDWLRTVDVASVQGEEWGVVSDSSELGRRREQVLG